MRLPLSLLVSVVSILIALSGNVHAITEDDEKAETRVQMRRIWEAIMAFKKDHGQIPDYLSDLIPQYLPHADALLSPTEKRTKRHGNNNYQDPKARSSFCYEFSAGKFARNTQTFRQVKEAQMEEFGGVVPILRCFLYERVLNVAYSGDLYESALYWETAPEARALTARIGPGPGFKNGQFAEMKVVDAESGAPVADAEVRLTARMYHFLPLPDRLLRTGADGTVRVPLGPALPPSRRLTVAVSKAGYFTPVENWQEGDLPDEVVVGLERGETVGGIVKLNDGSPLTEAQVAIKLVTPDAQGKVRETPIATEVTDASGRWKCNRVPKDFAGLSLRVYHPAARTTAFQSADQSAQGKVLRADLLTSAAELRVPPAMVLSGVVISADGKPVAGAEVIATEKTPIPANPAAARSVKNSEANSAKTDAEGRYSVPWPAAGPLTLLVFPPAGAPARIEMQASRAISEKAIRLASGRIIQGRILGEDGHPVSGTQVSFVRWDKTRIPAGRTVATSDADGNFSWPSAPAGSVELEFSCKGFFDRTSTIEADEGGPLATRMYRRTQQ